MIIRFQVGEEEFISDASKILRIIPIQGMEHRDRLTFRIQTPLPPGRAISHVVDLRDALRLPRRELGSQSRFLLVESHNLRVVILVDGVISIGTAEDAGLAPIEIRSVMTRGEAVVYEAESSGKRVQVMDFNQLLKDRYLGGMP